MFLVCGEALFDFFLESEAGPAAANFAARAGGSPFNVAIGLSRLDQASALLTGLSSDLLGQRLTQVLRDEGVSTAYAIPTDRPTTVSLVGLDAAGVPAYQFYDNGSADTGVVEADLPALGAEVAGLHFGSYSLAAAPVADAFAALARAERRALRLARPERPADGRARHGRLARTAATCSFRWPTLVKISAEDLELLRPGHHAESLAADLVGQGVRLVVVTDGGDGGDAGGPPAGFVRRRCRRGSRSSTPSAPATPSRQRCSRGCCATPRDRRRRWRRWTRTGWRSFSTTPRAPRRSPARGAAPICRGPRN